MWQYLKTVYILKLNKQKNLLHSNFNFDLIGPFLQAQRKTQSLRHPKHTFNSGTVFSNETSSELHLPPTQHSSPWWGDPPRLVRPCPVLMFIVYLWTRGEGTHCFLLLNECFYIYACVQSVAMSTISVHFTRTRWEIEDDWLLWTKNTASCFQSDSSAQAELVFMCKSQEITVDLTSTSSNKWEINKADGVCLDSICWHTVYLFIYTYTCCGWMWLIIGFWCQQGRTIKGCCDLSLWMWVWHRAIKSEREQKRESKIVFIEIPPITTCAWFSFLWTKAPLSSILGHCSPC